MFLGQIVLNTNPYRHLGYKITFRKRLRMLGFIFYFHALNRQKRVFYPNTIRVKHLVALSIINFVRESSVLCPWLAYQDFDQYYLIFEFYFNFFTKAKISFLRTFRSSLTFFYFCFFCLNDLRINKDKLYIKQHHKYKPI